MRSEEEQFAGLMQVARRTREFKPVVVCELGDVACLRVPGFPADVVYASDGYDIWDNGPLTTDLTEDEVVARIVGWFQGKN